MDCWLASGVVLGKDHREAKGKGLRRSPGFRNARIRFRASRSKYESGWAHSHTCAVLSATSRIGRKLNSALFRTLNGLTHLPLDELQVFLKIGLNFLHFISNTSSSFFYAGAVAFDIRELVQSALCFL